jgi:hypothetical protein
MATEPTGRSLVDRLTKAADAQGRVQDAARQAAEDAKAARSDQEPDQEADAEHPEAEG